MLQRSMIHAKTAIIRRLSSKMSIVHPWMVCFDLHMPHEVFDLLNKEILTPDKIWDRGWGYTRFSGYITFFQTWEDYLISSTSSKIVVGLEINLVKEKVRQSWLWTPRRRKQWSTMLKSRFWEQNFFMDTGIRMGLVRISQQWIEDARLNHRVTSIFLIPHWQKPVNLCAWTITKKDRLPTMDHGKYSLFSSQDV